MPKLEIVTHKTRGTSLAGAVCVISIALVAALTIASSASLNAGMLQQTENAQTASLLADSAIQQGVAELMKAPTWGNNAATDKIEYDGPVERSHVLLTFDKAAGVPYSTNNQAGTSPQGWPASRVLSHRTVPEQRVHLVAVGQCRNVTRTREALVYVPNYTVSLASTGKVHLTNSVVGALKSVADLASVDSNPDLLGPGDLATNSNLSDSVVLEQTSRITGNLQSRGDVTLESGSSVGGEVRRFYSNTELPHFDFDEYDPARPDPDSGGQAPLHYEVCNPGIHGNENLVGLVRCDGALSINGDLQLDNCLLYVTGNLSVTGGVRGSGAVIVKGNTVVAGGSTLTSDDNIALLSRGDISLLGSAGNPYMFQGLVYTRGNFMARYFTVVGGFVADGAVPGTGNVDLHGTKVYRAPMANHVDLYVPYQQALQFASVINEPAQDQIPVGDGNKFNYGRTPVTPNAPNTDPYPDPTNLYDTPALAAVYPNPGGDWDWWNPAFLQISRERVGGQEQFVYRLIFNGLTEGPFTTRQDLIDRIDQLHAQKCQAYHDGLDANGDPYPLEGPLVVPRDLGGGVIVPDPGFLELKIGDPNPLAGLQKDTSPYIKKAYDLKLAIWEKRNQIGVRGGSPVNFSFDPNRFLKENDKIRISVSQEY